MSVACRLSLPMLSVFLLLVLLVDCTVNALLVYDRQTLLDLRSSATDIIKFDHNGYETLPPFLSDSPAYLRRAPAPPPRRKRHRRRGKRSGYLVRLKAGSTHPPGGVRSGYGSIPRPSIVLRPLDPVGSWLVPVVGSEGVFQPRGNCSPRARWRGVNPGNLRPLCRAPRAADVADPLPPSRLGLVNARSVANKSLILKDFFISRGLDFLFITETWLNVGESSALIELLPIDCCYLNSPRTSGRGGGIAIVYKSGYKCKQLLLPSRFSSFELSLFEFNHPHTVLCAVVYRPPKYNKDFLNDFSTFLADIAPNYDRVLIVGDFNVHVCCSGNPLARDFLNIIDSFNFVQSVSGPTHELGHTLDLVLSYGLPVCNLEICDPFFSDHMPILFDIALCSSTTKHVATARRCRIINPSTAAQFSAVFSKNTTCPDSECANVEALSSWFCGACQTAMDTVAPYKTRQPKVKPEPWLNDATRSVRRECRRAERKLKKDKLHVSLQILRDCWRRYHYTVSESRRKYFANIVLSSCHKPRVLFKTINSVLNAPQTTGLEASPAVCEAFLNFFIEKVTSIRALISPPTNDPSVLVPAPAVFDTFLPVTLASLQEIIDKMKPSGSPNDAVPPRLFKEVFSSCWAVGAQHYE